MVFCIIYELRNKLSWAYNRFRIHTMHTAETKNSEAPTIGRAQPISKKNRNKKLKAALKRAKNIPVQQVQTVPIQAMELAKDEEPVSDATITPIVVNTPQKLKAPQQPKKKDFTKPACEGDQDDSATTRNKESHHEDYLIPIIYSNRDLVIINKPFDTCNAGDFKYSVLNLLNRHYTLDHIKKYQDKDRKFRFCHTLDYETSGTLCFGKTKQAAVMVDMAMQAKKVEKVYIVIVEGLVDVEELRRRMGNNNGSVMDGSEMNMDLSDENVVTVRSYIVNNKDKAYMDPLQQYKYDDYKRSGIEGGKESVTQFRVLTYGKWNGKDVTKIVAKLYTGRRHQIRLHCKLMGHVILGDIVYGGDNQAPRMMLHAHMLRITCCKNLKAMKEGDVATAISGDPLDQYIEQPKTEVLSLNCVPWLH